MNETMDTIKTGSRVESTGDVTNQQRQAIELIQDSAIPDELKGHFSDMIRLLGKETTEKDKASQILNIADELQLAKRAYLNNNKLDNLATADLLVSEIVKIYWL